MRLTGLAVVSAFLFLGLAGRAPAAPPPKEELVDQVRKAIDNGKTFLRRQQVETADGQGHWEVDLNSKGRHGGWTCLALLALLNAGEEPKAPIIQRGLKYIREIDSNDTYVVGLQTLVFAEAGFPQDLARIQRNVDWLVKARVMSGNSLLGWGYRATGPGTDNSNTQYALLGLWAGRTAGATVSRDVWESVRDFYVRTQEVNGGWYYIPAFRSPTMTMTTAGVCGLLIAGQALNVDQQELQKNGVALKCGIYPEDKAVANGITWMTRNWQLDPRHHTYYNLYGIERAGRLSGQRFFGEHDWYREGCKWLVDKQADDGSWYLRGQGFDAWPVISTSFALLYLSKGRTPVLMSKLVHGSPDHPTLDWNRKHSDLRHLTEYASKELFKRQPLAWQVFNARERRPESEAAVRELVGELATSPIAYFSGHTRPFFTSWEKKMLRQYIEQGGLIFAEACCGSEEFKRGFRELMNGRDGIFPEPEHKLQPLAPGHPIWRSHAVIDPREFKLEGIDFGCKTVVVFSPDPVSGFWEGNHLKDGRGQQAFRLGVNVIAYATGLELPKPKLFHVDVPADGVEGKAPRGFFRVLQLRTGDRYRSAANGLRNLMNDLRKSARLDVALKADELYPDDTDILNYKFLYMHGREDFDVKNVELLKANLENGATLFADACCGRPDFDRAFRALVKQMFDKPLEPIPVTDELYSAELNGTAIATVRCRRERKDGAGVEAEYQPVAPALEGIKIGKRWAVIYSKYDIGCALEKHQSSDCLGHDHDSAVKLARAAVLYSLQDPKK